MTLRCLAVLALVTGAPAQVGRVTTIQFPDKTTRVYEALYVPVDGDALPDIVLAVGDKDTPFQRRLHVHLAKGRRAPFAQIPDRTIDVPRSVTAFGVADVHADPGHELVWFGARGVYAYRATAPERQRIVKLVACEFLFQFTHTNRIYSWQRGLRDLNGDGLVDLLLPESGGYRIAIQQRSGNQVTFVESSLTLPERISERHRPRGASRNPVSDSRQGGEVRLTLDLGMGRQTPPLVRIQDTVPSPRLSDWDGDGDLDILVKHGQKVFVWTQVDNRYAPAPTETLEFPLTRDKAVFDASFAAHVTEYSGDKRTDAVLFTKDRGSDEVRTHVLFFNQRPGQPSPLFNKGTPQQLLVIAGFTRDPSLTDIDGDGSPDLQVSAWRLDVLDQIQGGGGLDVDLYVYLNKKGRFTRKPVFTHKETLETSATEQNSELFARFFGDVTGDGVQELLIRSRPEHVRLMMVRKDRSGGLRMIPRPLHELKIEKDADLRLLNRNPKHLGLLVLESNQVLLVTY